MSQITNQAEPLRLDTQGHIELRAVVGACRNGRSIEGARVQIVADRCSARNPGATGFAPGEGESRLAGVTLHRACALAPYPGVPSSAKGVHRISRRSEKGRVAQKARWLTLVASLQGY